MTSYLHVSFTFVIVFFFKQKTAYEMRISDWSSDVCSSDLAFVAQIVGHAVLAGAAAQGLDQIGNLQIGEDLGGGGAGDVEDLAANRQDRLRLAIARLLGRAAGRIALADEAIGARGTLGRPIGELSRAAQLWHRWGGLCRDNAWLDR